VATGSETAALLHPEAVQHLPPFVALPGATDWLMVGMGIFLLLMIVALGVFYLKLHALPEHMAHRGQKVQYEIVAVLALIALFTHNHAFWIVGLLLALIPIPDLSTPLSSMAQSLGRMAGRDRDPVHTTPPDEPAAATLNPSPEGAGAGHA
jgi:hypothetical protein